MKIGKRLYIVKRTQWRRWLAAHHNKEKDVWLVYYRKESGKPRIDYNDAVEEALCYGWIDSTIKKIDKDRFAQRFSPRRPNSVLSEMNRQRLLKLVKERRITKAGLGAVAHVFEPSPGRGSRFVIPPDIRDALKKNSRAWKHFQAFPESYRRIRIHYIDHARKRNDVFQKRLKYFILMTARNRRIGYVKEWKGEDAS